MLAGEGEDVEGRRVGERRQALRHRQNRKRNSACTAAASRTQPAPQPQAAPTPAQRRRCSAAPAHERQPHLLVSAGAPARERRGHRSRRASKAPVRMAASIARDIEAAQSGKGLQAPRRRRRGAAQVAACGPSDEQIRALFEDGSYEVVPHDGMRSTIAQRLTQSTQTIPHFYLTMDCNIDKLLAAREEINASAPKDKDGKPAYKLSVNDFVIKALALALQRIPNANVSWTEGGMLKHKHSDVGVAVAMPGGLITPIVRKAETKSLSTISNEMKDFAARARARKLKPEEYQGGTTAVSNLGMYGIKDFAAVINPPQATILAVGAGEQRAVVRGRQGRSRDDHDA